MDTRTRAYAHEHVNTRTHEHGRNQLAGIAKILPHTPSAGSRAHLLEVLNCPLAARRLHLRRLRPLLPAALPAAAAAARPLLALPWR